jgi:hypothetical protein
MGDVFAHDHKVERFRDAKRAFDFEARARCRKISHHAADAAGAVELDRSRLEYAVPRTAPAFIRHDLTTQDEVATQ